MTPSLTCAQGYEHSPLAQCEQDCVLLMMRGSDDEPGDAVDETGAEEASVEPNRDVAVDDTSDEKPGDAVDPAPGDADDCCDSDVCETGTLDNGFWVMPRDVVVAPFPDETLL